ncbi:hypothetical protein GC169_04710 [bacterium]|nr:hypothetical protein [bacterium]
MRVLPLLHSTAFAFAAFTGAASAQQTAVPDVKLDASPASISAKPQAAPVLLPTAAAAYADYQSEVGAIASKPLASSDELDSALDTFGAQNADQLSSGWISYAALVAAQNKEFAAAVRDIDSFYGRDRVVSGMRNDVGYARTLKGGEDAVQAALNVNSRDAVRISSAAAFVKEQAYSLQKVAWGKAKVKDAGAAASNLKLSSRTARPVAEAAKKLFLGGGDNVVLASAAQGSVWDRVANLTASASGSAISAIAPGVGETRELKVDPRREGTVNRMATLAAFHVLGAETSHEQDVKAAMRDKPTTDCIDWSQLQLQACVSASYTRSDLSFCLAEHAIGDAGACFADIAR